MKNRINSGFHVLSDAALLLKARGIVTSLTGNSNFPLTTPGLETLELVVTNFADALLEAQKKGRDQVAAKNQAREDLLQALRQLASSVMTIANGNRLMLVSSGFDLSKERETKPLNKPRLTRVSDGKNTGELEVKVSAVKGAKAYIFLYATDAKAPESEWKQEVASSSKCLLKNLDSGQRYWCRVVAVGSFSQIAQSEVVSRIAQ